MHIPTTGQFAHIVAEHELETLDVFGPTLEFLVPPQPNDEAPCVMKGMIPPGVAVPIHSHAGVETFFLISGELEILTEEGGKRHWLTARPGDFINVPENAKHAFRNRSSYPAVQLITSSSRLGRFFQDVGRPTGSGEITGPPSQEELQHFVQIAEGYGYWLASPEENAAVGLSLI